jgi:CRISPR-associated protein Csx16
MPIKYFVTRHNGAVLWARDAGIRARKIEQANFDVSIVRPGDVVMGTLPVHLAAAVIQRGKELTAAQMRDCNARLEEYRILARGAKMSTRPDVEDVTLVNEPRLIHVMLASQQIVPNLLPALSLRCDGVALLVSAESAIKKAATILRRLLEDAYGKQKDFRVAEYSLGESQSYPDLIERCLTARNTILEQANGTALLVNITGGTKLMALAASEAFAGRGYIAYCNTALDQIECLDPPGHQPLALSYDSMNFEQYLGANRYAIVENGDAVPSLADMLARRELTGFLAANSEKLSTTQVARGRLEQSKDGRTWQLEKPDNFNGGDSGRRTISILSRLLHIGSSVRPWKKAPYHGFARLMLPAEGDHATWFAMLKRLEAAKLLKILSASAGTVGADDCVLEWKFASEACARYVGGTWLEEFAALTARDVVKASGLDVESRVHAGVQIMNYQPDGRGNDRALNELDLAIYHQGRLLIIEAKAGGTLFDKGQDALNKLERLKKSAGGPFGDAWILALRDLADRGADVLSRAQVYGIHCHHGAGALQRLHRNIGDWLRSDYEGKSPPLWSEEQWRSRPGKEGLPGSRVASRSTAAMPSNTALGDALKHARKAPKLPKRGAGPHSRVSPRSPRPSP